MASQNAAQASTEFGHNCYGLSSHHRATIEPPSSHHRATIEPSSSHHRATIEPPSSGSMARWLDGSMARWLDGSMARLLLFWLDGSMSSFGGYSNRSLVHTLKQIM
jgi:hypothetical protein